MITIYDIYEGILDPEFATDTRVDNRVALGNKLQEFGLKEIVFVGKGWSALETRQVKAIKRDTSLLHKLVSIQDNQCPEELAYRFAGIIFNLLLNIESQEIDFYTHNPWDTGTESTGVDFIRSILLKSYKVDSHVSLEENKGDAILEIYSWAKSTKNVISPTIKVKFIFDSKQFEKHFD